MLLHDKKFPDIKLKLTGRERQLFKPILRIFDKTESKKELYPVITNYINNRRSVNIDSLHAFVYRIVKILIRQFKSHALTSNDIWAQVYSNLTGEFLYNGNTTFESAEFGRLTQKKVSTICKDVLGATPDRNTSNRGFVFEKKKMDQLDKLFNISLVKI